MLEKWKQRAIEMNFKKAVLVFLAVSFILVLGFSTALYGNFKDRTDQWESVVKTDREHQNEEKGDEQDDRNDFDGKDYREEHSDRKDYEKEHSDRKAEMELEQIWEEAHLSTGDIALITGCGIIGAGLALWYWLLCMVWAYRKSERMGVDSTLWVLAALFFNLAAIAILYFYAVLKGTCDQCGRIRLDGGKYCDRCGKPFVKKCQGCGQTVDIKADHCGNCGKKLSEDEDVS